jgi:hypothetical protein
LGSRNFVGHSLDHPDIGKLLLEDHDGAMESHRKPWVSAGGERHDMRAVKRSKNENREWRYEARKMPYLSRDILC